MQWVSSTTVNNSDGIIKVIGSSLYMHRAGAITCLGFDSNGGPLDTKVGGCLGRPRFYYAWIPSGTRMYVFLHVRNNTAAYDYAIIQISPVVYLLQLAISPKSNSNTWFLTLH